VETFFSYKVTHIVTGHPEVKEGSQKDYVESSSRSPDIVIIGTDFGMKVWPPSSNDLIDLELKNVMDTILHGSSQPAPHTNSLQEALKKEKIFGLPTNRNTAALKTFKGYYLIVEEPSGSYRPIVMKEYDRNSDLKNPPWPVMHLKNHSAHTVFALPTQIGEDRTEKSSAESENDKNSILTKDSNASGLVSGSITSIANRLPMGENAIISNMSNRIHDPIGIKRNRAMSDENDLPAKKNRNLANTKEIKEKIPLIPAKAGYCENCVCKFDDYYKVFIFLYSTFIRRNIVDMHQMMPISQP
jgi:hypothetical protein